MHTRAAQRAASSSLTPCPTPPSSPGTTRPRTAPSYPKAASRFRRARIKALRFVRYIRGRDAIDIGCGGGFMVEAMRRVGARTAGLDINPQAITYAERHFPENRFFCEDVAAFEGHDLAFDFV